MTDNTPLIDAMRTKDTLTENGMLTNSTSLNACTDLFFTLGAMRGQDKNRLVQNVNKAWHEDTQSALRILYWGRDVREGAGERQVFKDSMSSLIPYDGNESLRKNIVHIPEYGRYDDLMTFMNTKYEIDALEVIKHGLDMENALCAKWMDRQGDNFHKVRKFMNMPSSKYRKLLTGLSNTVEAKMAAGEWGQIEYGKLPSLASARYQKAFGRNDAERYSQYIQGLQKGTEKINAGALYPYDVTKSLRFGEVAVAEEQWKSLPNYLKATDRRILPVCDVSGSMDQPTGGNPNVTAMDACIALGLYISERNTGPFQDAFITFSESPKLQVVQGSLQARYHQLERAQWDSNTDLEKTFYVILQKAQESKVLPQDMPTDILILSDMEFDRSTNFSESAQEMIERMYSEAGYKMPNIIYWNLASRQNNIPVKFNKQGTALVSGFSPAIMSALLASEDMTPVGMMNKQINSPRYEQIRA